MVISIYKIEYMGFVFLAPIILLSLICVKSNMDVAFSQTISISTPLPIENSTYVVIPPLGDKQSKVY